MLPTHRLGSIRDSPCGLRVQSSTPNPTVVPPIPARPVSVGSSPHPPLTPERPGRIPRPRARPSRIARPLPSQSQVQISVPCVLPVRGAPEAAKRTTRQPTGTVARLSRSTIPSFCRWPRCVSCCSPAVGKARCEPSRGGTIAGGICSSATARLGRVRSGVTQRPGGCSTACRGRAGAGVSGASLGGIIRAMRPPIVPRVGVAPRSRRPQPALTTTT